MVLAKAVNRRLSWYSDDMEATKTDRRARRRQETIEEICDIAVDIMAAEGVNALSIAEIARRLGVRPPSLYKYFPSLMAIFDALFRRGQLAHLEEFRQALNSAEPGLPALTAALDASGRWCLANPTLAQLLFWRPVPNFEPTPEAFAPSIEMVSLQRDALAEAVARGQLRDEASSDEAVALLGTMINGVVGMAIANEPDVAWGQGQFSRQFARLMEMFASTYAPKRSSVSKRRR
jgi:AcrR family transcriptional regulator